MTAQNFVARALRLATSPRYRSQQNWVAGIMGVISAMIFTYFEFDHPSWRLRYPMDVDVYRLGVQAFLRHEQLYDVLLPTKIDALPFVYPPFAALIMTPFAFFSPEVDGLIIGIITFVLALYCTIVALRAVGFARPITGGLTVLPLVLLCIPTWQTLGYGQINMVLLALVLTDIFNRPSRIPAGVLTGVAVAIKLTPLVFVLYWVAKKQFRPIIGVGAGFVGATLLGALWYPPYTWRYFTHAMFTVSDYVDPGFIMNASLNGVIRRAGGGGVEWLIAALVTMSVAWWVCYDLRSKNQDLLALVCLALGGLLASPISWFHHWVILPAAVIALLASRHWWLALMLAVVGLLLRTTGLQLMITDAAIVVLLWLGWCAVRERFLVPRRRRPSSLSAKKVV